MLRTLHAVIPLLALAFAGCASQPTRTAQDAPAASPSAPAALAAQPYGTPRIVKSKDGRIEGEVIGTPAPTSKFARLQIGMKMSEVTALIGGPDDMVRHETGKRWIPFYFGADVQRMQALYKGEGCLTYTGGNAFGGGGNDLIRITVTPRSDCTQ